MDDDLRTYLANITKELAKIAGSLQILATVAKETHPDAFREASKPPFPPRT